MPEMSEKSKMTYTEGVIEPGFVPLAIIELV